MIDISSQDFAVGVNNGLGATWGNEKKLLVIIPQTSTNRL
jgi:hypothetical protein